MNSEKAFLLDLYKQGVTSCLPSVCLPDYFDEVDVSQGVCIIGAGKAAADMAAAAYKKYGDACFGKVVTRYGYGTELPTGNIEVLYAAHPVPDEKSLEAGQALLELAKNNPANIPIIFLISGGGSALMCLPVEGISFADKLSVHKFLLRSGASIDEMNVVRKQLSQVKGGGLALVAKSEVYTYVISDVVGDDPSIIASGPTVIDHSTAKQALDILNKYNWPFNAAIDKVLKSAVDLPIKQNLTSEYAVVANANTAIDSAIQLAQQQGWQTQVLNYEQQGEAADVAKQHAKIAKSLLAEGKQLLLFSGGELTVTVKDACGEGGPNQEYALAMAIALEGQAGISVLSCDTDGVDGSKDVAGAFVHEASLSNAKKLGLAPQEYLDNHDSYHFFEALEDLIITGPTQTNVNDFRVIMIHGN
ncbi:glycerate kinase [Paraglaciecola sp. L3A3]|uniref:glycerate kinase type-2 family protein n=1 Tax=Paraglaciecola sp. L3A3 TaxID=2686358 RepID=UPI00131B20DF|nr:DUF4147 domain-containing protein [Paraglaciecola sp. L3A3]